MTAMTGESWHLEASYNSRTIWGATPPKVYSPESLQNAGFYRRLAVRRGLPMLGDDDSTSRGLGRTIPQ